MFFTTPTLLTWARIVVIPLIILVYWVPYLLGWFAGVDKSSYIGWYDWVAVILFVMAAVTDWLDGFLARKLNQTSAFGAFLDPVADKLLVSASLLVLLFLQRVDPFVVLIIIGREISVSALREWMARIGASGNVAVHMIGKAKTAVQMVAIPFLLLSSQIGGLDTKLWGTGLIYLAALLTILSMAFYLRKAWPAIKELDEGKDAVVNSQEK